MKLIISLLLLVISVSITGCNKKKIDAVAEGEKLMEVSREWSQTVPTKDVDKMLSYWADDAVMIQPYQPPITGKDSIRAMIEDAFKNPAFSISWEPLEAHVSDDGSMGYLLEQNKIILDDSTTLYHRAVTVWRKSTDGEWKNVAEISTPMPRNE